MYDVVIARIIHIVGIVVWIGGVVMVTSVILPAIKKFKSVEERVEFFEKVEHKFANQARVTTLITALSGFYMIIRLNLWDRFLDASHWWMYAMVIVWLIFTLMLFVLEPLFLQKKLIERSKTDPEGTYNRILRLHIILSTLSLATIIGAVAGSRGWLFF